MGVEIERKFLVVDDSWRAGVVAAHRIVQGYLADEGELTVRVRIKGDHGFLTLKGRTQGISRNEYEYEIPVADAEAMLADFATGPVVEKTRHLIDVDGHVWELDVFAGDNEGLVMAEIELASADEVFTLASWAGEEVTDDSRYYNVNLARHPFRQWGRS
ncbi:MAG TPA: CYTH domain-containing protein [Actinomycetota bacterium]|nr:CYTH domain-containing protein [Actinomycetota bacterium]